MRGWSDERAAAAGPLEALLAGQLAQRAPDGDQAAAVALRELALGRQPVAGAPFARVEGGAQVEIDLVVQRDGSELEPEACHAVASGPPCDRRRGSGLARLAILLITL